jgi:adenylylsulfate kinase-like enzyme
MNKAIWFFGYSGCGKTFASKFLKKKIKKSVIIDGDEVRKYISFDLNYTKKDREIQIQRVFGLAKILIAQGIFPIISTVFFNNKIYRDCKKLNIKIIKIERSDIKQIMYHCCVFLSTSCVCCRFVHWSVIINQRFPVCVLFLLNGSMVFASRFDC